MITTTITTMATIVHVGDGVGLMVELEDGELADGELEDGELEDGELERGLEVGIAVGDGVGVKVGLGALKTHSELH